MAYITFCVYFTMLSPKSICTTINYKNNKFLFKSTLPREIQQVFMLFLVPRACSSKSSKKFKQIWF
jgi:hypothetical protein